MKQLKEQGEAKGNKSGVLDWLYRDREMKLPVPDHCVCNGKGMISTPRGYTWCICHRTKDWPLQCLRACGLKPSQLEAWTLDAWSEALNAGCNDGYRLISRYVGKGATAPWVVLWGSPGTGKTHLLIAATGALCAQGIAAAYMTAYELEQNLKNAIGDNTLNQLTRQLSRVAVLVIDDYGTQMDTDFVNAEFHAILDKRYTEMKRTLLSIEPLSVAEDAAPPS